MIEKVSKCLLLLLVIISSYGYVVALLDQYKLRIEFAPAIVASGIMITIFFAGLLNVLVPVTWVIFIGGFISLAWQAVHGHVCLRSIFAPTNVILLLAMCFFGWRLNGLVMKHYDNFSHWLLIIRDMLTENALPSYKTSWIVFQSYPPGTACFIYYITRIVGDTESLLALAQSLLITCFVLPAFAIPRSFRKISFPLLIAPFAVMYTANIFVSNLLVDSVLSFVGLGGIVMVWHYRNSLKKALICGIPTCCALILIKNSGFFFAGIIVAILTFSAFLDRRRWRAVSYTVLTGTLLPAGVMLLWTRHTALVFDNAGSTRHALSIATYLEQLKTNATQEFLEGLRAVMSVSFDFRVKLFMALVLMALALLVIAGLFMFMKDRRSARFVVLSVLAAIIIYILWCSSILMMYVTSKELNAKDLASFSRYQATIIIFLVGVLSLVGISSLNRMTLENRHKNNTICLAIIILVSAILLTPLSLNWSNTSRILFSRADVAYPFRVNLTNLRLVNTIDMGKRYLIYQNFEDSGAFYRYVYRYEFLSPNVVVVTPTSDLKWQDAIDDYDYFIIISPEDEIESEVIEMKEDGKLDHVKVIYNEE